MTTLAAFLSGRAVTTTWRDHILAAAASLPPYILSDWEGGPHGRMGYSIKNGEVTFVVTLPANDENPPDPDAGGVGRAV